MQIFKWGNSLAIRLPKSIVETLVLKEGDEVSLQIIGKKHLAIAKRSDSKALLGKVRSLRGRMPSNFVFERQKANSR